MRGVADGGTMVVRKKKSGEGFRLAPAIGGMVMLGREKGGLRLSGMGGGRAELKGAGMDGAVHRLH